MGGLSFLYPAFLIGALAISVPIILHLLRRKTETVVEFPAVRLLEKAPIEQQRRRRLREIILLILRVSALLLLAFAFARPYFTGVGAIATAPITLVAIDTSMSLTAPKQFDAARDAARRAIDEAPVADVVGLLTFADSATVLVPPTVDRAAARAAIDSVVPGAGGTRYRTALARAAEVVGQRQGRVIVITDLQQIGWEVSDEGGVPDGLDVRVVEVKPPAGNLAITSVRREGRDVVVAVHNFGGRPARIPVRVLVDGKEVGASRAEIGPQAAADARVPSQLPARGAAEVRIEDPEGYQPDNSRFFVLDPPSPIPVTLITSDPTGLAGGLYVERALGVASGGGAFRVTVVDGQKFSTWPPAQVDEQAALAVLATRTLDRQGRDTIARYLSNGGQVWLTLGADIDVATLRDVIGADPGVDDKPVVVGTGVGTIVTADARHPVFRPFLSASGALGDVRMEQYRRLKDQAGRSVLARLPGGAPAFTEQTVGRGRLLIFASDLDNQWNRFPLNAAFVPFTLETVRYLTQGREERQALVMPESPNGSAAAPGVVEVPAAGGKPFDSAQGGPGEMRRVAVNVDVRESNPIRTTADEFTGAITRLSAAAGSPAQMEAREREGEQRLWQIGLVVMFLALASEGFIGRRAS
jgi:hypothetical protein